MQDTPEHIEAALDVLRVSPYFEKAHSILITAPNLGNYISFEDEEDIMNFITAVQKELFNGQVATSGVSMPVMNITHTTHTATIKSLKKLLEEPDQEEAEAMATKEKAQREEIKQIHDEADAVVETMAVIKGRHQCMSSMLFSYCVFRSDEMAKKKTAEETEDMAVEQLIASDLDEEDEDDEPPFKKARHHLNTTGIIDDEAEEADEASDDDDFGAGAFAW